MTMIQFTKNYADHSNDTGFQFEYFCDKCGNGWRSQFKANKIGFAAGIFRTAANIFGGSLGSLATAGEGAKDLLRGKAWDDAFTECVNEGKSHFKQCTRCGRWVCPDVCWNPERGMCDQCAPKLAQEAASAQARVAVEQVWEKAKGADQTEGLDLSKKQSVAGNCPHCNAQVGNAKFCPECGKPVGPAGPTKCKCGALIAPKAKFCAECGSPRA
jgi:hypothetical protein